MIREEISLLPKSAVKKSKSLNLQYINSSYFNHKFYLSLSLRDFGNKIVINKDFS